MAVKVSSRYQVVIPVEVRRALGLRPGVMVDVIAKGGVAYLVPVKSVASVTQKLKAALTTQNVKTVREKKDRAV